MTQGIQGKAKCFGFLFAVLTMTHVWADGVPRGRPEDLGSSSERLDYIDKFYAEKVARGEMAGIVTLVL